MREVVIPDEDPEHCLHHKEENTDINKESSGNINDCISTGLQSCSQVVSNVDEEDEVESTPPGKEWAESANPESESEVRICL